MYGAKQIVLCMRNWSSFNFFGGCLGTAIVKCENALEGKNNNIKIILFPCSTQRHDLIGNNFFKLYSFKNR